MKVSVKATDDLDRLAARVAREAPRALRASLEAEVDRVGRAAHASWPVRTGRSKAALRWGVRGGETIEAFVENGEDYADDIEPKGGGRPVWDRLVVEPLRAAFEAWTRRAGDIIRGVAR